MSEPATENFLARIFSRLESGEDTVFLNELREENTISATGQELLSLIGKAQKFILQRGLKKGERCALLAHNGIRWVATDLALMAQGVIVVPLYARQEPSELVTMMKDCSPALICCGDAALRDGILKVWPEAPPQALLDEIFGDLAEDISGQKPSDASASESARSPSLVGSDPATIIYTSGTSGEAKGVIINHANVTHMLNCTSARLDVLMENKSGQDRVFHYLPFCFAGSWIMLLTCLLRRSMLTMNTDLSKLANEMRDSAPDYFLNVPALLERMRKAVDEQLWKTGGVALKIHSRAKSAWIRKNETKSSFADSVWLGLANSVIFPTIRKKMIGGNLRALICGSAPLNIETQLYFSMLRIPVLQVYGLTETTAICTMDDPRHVVPGRVGTAVSGIEMKLGEGEEIVVRGPNIFPGYWNRPEETAKLLRDGWFQTGDQGEVDSSGNWRIAGRIKNLIILGSGHNVAPEPIEDKILQSLPEVQQVVVVGNGRGYLSAIVTGKVTRESLQAALDMVNADLPHYKQVRAFSVREEPFSIDNGLLTANGKLKRDLITRHFQREIEELYGQKQAS
ncbi:MAG: AMP-binding protein [Acidobacteriota bacterium]|nr:AMP-binding protein [Acidobacteriota bacterium]